MPSRTWAGDGGTEQNEAKRVAQRRAAAQLKGIEKAEEKCGTGGEPCGRQIGDPVPMAVETAGIRDGNASTEQERDQCRSGSLGHSRSAECMRPGQSLNAEPTKHLGCLLDHVFVRYWNELWEPGRGRGPEDQRLRAAYRVGGARSVRCDRADTADAEFDRTRFRPS